jgi:hypothetical protein
MGMRWGLRRLDLSGRFLGRFVFFVVGYWHLCGFGSGRVGVYIMGRCRGKFRTYGGGRWKRSCRKVYVCCNLSNEGVYV